MQKRDLNQTAFAVVQQATQQKPSTKLQMPKAAISVGRVGALKRDALDIRPKQKI